MSTMRRFAVSGRTPITVLVSAALWFVLGAVGSVESFNQLLVVEVMSGMVGPAVYLPSMAYSLLFAAVALVSVFLAFLLSRGRQWARLALTPYAVAIPVVLFLPVVSVARGPWISLLASPAGAAVLASVVATVLMWLPSANRYFKESATVDRVPSLGEVPEGGAPAAVVASVWGLTVAGVVAALQGVIGVEFAITWVKELGVPAAAIVLWVVLVLIGVADVVLATRVQRGRAWARVPVSLLPVAGLGLLVAVTLSMYAPSSVGPWASSGVFPVILGMVITQGTSFVIGLIPGVLVWLPSARRYLVGSR